MGDILILTILAIAVTLSARSLYKSRKAGHCCGNCSHCKGCGQEK